MGTGPPKSPAAVGADLELRDIRKSFGGVLVVDDVSLAVAPGELISILGPSGCGKTTTLRIIAGFVEPDAGRVLLQNSDVTHVPPYKRDVGMLFQSYALFPHLTVVDNVGFGLKMRGVGRRERRRQAQEALEQVRLGEFAERYPRQLSGGQQQRVALARAIVIRPSVLLLDEPLSNLDARLRQDLRGQIRELQQRLAITTVFVTHDQEEALTVSDRIVVMNHGQIEQVGRPAEIYRSPQTRFVTEFIGEANIIAGHLEPSDSGEMAFTADKGIGTVVVAARKGRARRAAAISLRPEALRLFHPDDPRALNYANRFPGTVIAATFLGAASVFRVMASSSLNLKIMQANRGDGDEFADFGPELNQPVVVAWKPEWCNVLEASDERRERGAR